MIFGDVRHHVFFFLMGKLSWSAGLATQSVGEGRRCSFKVLMVVVLCCREVGRPTSDTRAAPPTDTVQSATFQSAA